MAKLWLFCACLCLVGSAYAGESTPLRLDDAIKLALENSPAIKGAEAEYGAAFGERHQSGSLLNPVVGFEAENFNGNGIYNSTNNSEWTIGLSQTVEIGGKRPARIQAADNGLQIAQYGKSIAALDLIRSVKLAFANVVAIQEEAVITQEQAILARDVYKSVDKRVSAAAEPLVQRNKAKILLANAELISEQTKRQRNISLKMLGLLMGGKTINSVSTERFYELVKPEMNTNIQKSLQNSVDYKQKSAGISQAKSILHLERANSIPNPTFNIGVRDFRATNNQALVVGISLPLPVFNLNQGNIEKSRQLVVKADADRQKSLLIGQTNIAEHNQSLQNAYLTALKIKSVILPEAQEAFVQARRGYNAGKFAYLEVLDAQRTLTDTRLAYIRTLRDFHIQKAEIERLLAHEFETGQIK